ncbi:unnamed protein product [Acanthocheilonema viteae]|uniref:BPTI/Kunitz inhibitor domain-containing protein n=1 Tax=Acanthocheilonema viteae TaxID=6277 RepID=A0A498S7E8_ACAVI|nr:unnamed protein product [Acanthocheilonema viteae]
MDYLLATEISCVLPDDAMKRKVEISSDSLSSANQITPITESIFTESLIAHSSPIPHLSALSLSISKMGSFPSSETVTEQGPLLFSPKTSEENFTVKILPQICLLPALTGPCSKTKVLWYYNSLTGRCERFSFSVHFSGCGNANHFRTRKECEETCSVEYFI